MKTTCCLFFKDPQNFVRLRATGIEHMILACVESFWESRRKGNISDQYFEKEIIKVDSCATDLRRTVLIKHFAREKNVLLVL